MKLQEFRETISIDRSAGLFEFGCSIETFIDTILNPYHGSCNDFDQAIDKFIEVNLDGLFREGDEGDVDEIALIRSSHIHDASYNSFSINGFMNNIFVAAQYATKKMNMVTYVDDDSSELKSNKRAIISTTGSRILPIVSIGYLKNGAMVTSNIPYYIHDDQVKSYDGGGVIPDDAKVPISAVYHAIIKLVNNDDIDINDTIYIKASGFSEFTTIEEFECIIHNVLRNLRNGKDDVDVTLLAKIM